MTQSRTLSRNRFLSCFCHFCLFLSLERARGDERGELLSCDIDLVQDPRSFSPRALYRSSSRSTRTFQCRGCHLGCRRSSIIVLRAARAGSFLGRLPYSLTESREEILLVPLNPDLPSMYGFQRILQQIRRRGIRSSWSVDRSQPRFSKSD